ncbi:hypothetical protein [Microbulbifer aestuariivivens]|uniref:hypothetical protein n=1 Tax=Microbulbifer aestuariivivens TaxID=1908308 RepID=UPI0031EF220C
MQASFYEASKELFKKSAEERSKASSRVSLEGITEGNSGGAMQPPGKEHRKTQKRALQSTSGGMRVRFTGL